MTKKKAPAKKKAPVKVVLKSNNPDGRPSKRPPTAKKLPCASCGKMLGINKFRLRTGSKNMNSYCNDCLMQKARDIRAAKKA